MCPMQRRCLFVIALFVFVVQGCKTGKESLAAQTASAQLEASVFAAPNDVQSLTFISGGARAQKPFPFDGFLYAKHWLTCAATEPGPFAQTSVCTFNAEGRTYAHETDGRQLRRPAAAQSAKRGTYRSLRPSFLPSPRQVCPTRRTRRQPTLTRSSRTRSGPN